MDSILSLPEKDWDSPLPILGKDRDHHCHSSEKGKGIDVLSETRIASLSDQEKEGTNEWINPEGGYRHCQVRGRGKRIGSNQRCGVRVQLVQVEERTSNQVLIELGWRQLQSD